LETGAISGFGAGAVTDGAGALNGAIAGAGTAGIIGMINDALTPHPLPPACQ
jgi:hypothetical protein